MDFVTFFKTAQNRYRFLHGGFIHNHRLEAAFERGIFLEPAAVLVLPRAVTFLQVEEPKGKLFAPVHIAAPGGQLIETRRRECLGHRVIIVVEPLRAHAGILFQRVILLHRHFAFEHLATFDEAAWQIMRAPKAAHPPAARSSAFRVQAHLAGGGR
mgnify:CR=1 FL=1